MRYANDNNSNNIHFQCLDKLSIEKFDKRYENSHFLKTN